MTTAELERIARDIVPPRGAGFAVAVVDHTPGGKLSNGVPSGLGGRTAYRVAFLVDGVSKSAPVGPPFARPREATAFARYLNGQAATPRPAAPTTLAGAGEPEGTSGRLIGAPEPVHPPAPSAPERPAGPEALGSVTAAKGTGSSARVCRCGSPIPWGSRADRQTCSTACRVAASRERSLAKERRPASTAEGIDVTPSRASGGVARIGLTRGMTALVDEADEALVRPYHWYAHKSGHDGHWYARTSVPGQPQLRMHRLILGVGPHIQVDHINGDGLDNRRANLRPALRGEQAANSRPRPSRTGYRGVRVTASGRFQAEIKVDGRNRYLGTFSTAEEAAKAYDREVVAQFGAFARPNFGPDSRSRRVKGSPGPTGHAESRRPAQTSAPRPPHQLALPVTG